MAAATPLSTMERLMLKTHIVEYSPRCAYPFLVRLVGPGAGMLDKESVSRTRDVLGFGQTYEEAAKDALALLEKRKAKSKA